MICPPGSPSGASGRICFTAQRVPHSTPPLRERASDIPLLASHLAGQCARRLGKRISGIEQSAVDLLVSYEWPGNVRELQNVIERALTPGLACSRSIGGSSGKEL